MAMEDNYYAVLGLEAGASVAQVKATYRDLAKKYHPDCNNGDPSCQERLKQINAAYDYLSDPQKKTEWDAQFQSAKQDAQQEKRRKEERRRQEEFRRREQARKRAAAAENSIGTGAQEGASAPHRDCGGYSQSQEFYSAPRAHEAASQPHHPPPKYIYRQQAASKRSGTSKLVAGFVLILLFIALLAGISSRNNEVASPSTHETLPKIASPLASMPAPIVLTRPSAQTDPAESPPYGIDYDGVYGDRSSHSGKWTANAAAPEAASLADENANPTPSFTMRTKAGGGPAPDLRQFERR